METAKKVTNERSGREDEKPSVACTVMDVSAQWQFSEGGQPRKTAEGINRFQLQSSSIRTEAIVAEVSVAGAEAAWRGLDRVRELCAGRRLTVDCSGVRRRLRVWKRR